MSLTWCRNSFLNEASAVFDLCSLCCETQGITGWQAWPWAATFLSSSKAEAGSVPGCEDESSPWRQVIGCMNHLHLESQGGEKDNLIWSSFKTFKNIILIQFAHLLICPHCHGGNMIFFGRKKEKSYLKTHNIRIVSFLKVYVMPDSFLSWTKAGVYTENGGILPRRW